MGSLRSPIIPCTCGARVIENHRRSSAVESWCGLPVDSKWYRYSGTMPGKQLGVRIDEELLERIERLIQLIPGSSRGGLIRASLEEGLKVLEARFLTVTRR